MKIYPRKDRPSKKGWPLVYLHESGQRISLDLHCPVNRWNQNDQKIKGNDDEAVKLNKKLRVYKLKMEEIMEKTSDFTIIKTEFEAYLKGDKPYVNIEPVPLYNPLVYEKLTASGKEFYKLIDNLIHSHRSDWSEGYRKRFRTIRTKILAHDPNFTTDKLTSQEWWRSFVNYCIEDKGNVSNTISTDAKTIEALKGELGIKGESFDWSYIEPKILALSWDKVLGLTTDEMTRKLTEYPKATLLKSRTLWLASAFTGRRWEEVTTITKDHFYQKEGRWRYHNIGKGQSLVDFMLMPEAVEFFKSINFTLPKLANQTVNEDIKIICRVAGYKDRILQITPINANNSRRDVYEEWETVHYHTARHSYGQYMAQLAVKYKVAFPDKWVSARLGHASYATTWKYMNQSESSLDQTSEKIFYPD